MELNAVMSKSNPLVVGYYTPDRNYKELATNMKASVERFGLECVIRERPSLAKPHHPKPMPWVLNCSQCGHFIKEMMDEFVGRDLLYLDADATMEKRPSLFLDEPTNYDFAAPFLTNKYVQKELQSNTLFFANTVAAKTLLHNWCFEQDRQNKLMITGKMPHPFFKAWDQRVLQDVLSTVADLRVKELPYTYGKLDKTPKGEELMLGIRLDDIVIAQHQASRQNKVYV
jgi:hypothetical protein